MIALLVLTALSLAFYTYMLVRPISYGMGYRTEVVYDGETFEGVMEFSPDLTVVNSNTNFDEEMVSRYYYKDGYVFFTLAQTDEDFAEEVEDIQNNFYESVNTPFYAAEANAFRLAVGGGDGDFLIYVCEGAIAFAAVFGAIELILIALCLYSMLLCKKRGR